MRVNTVGVPVSLRSAARSSTPAHGVSAVSVFRSGDTAQTLGEYMTDAEDSKHEDTTDVDPGFKNPSGDGPSQGNPDAENTN